MANVFNPRRILLGHTSLLLDQKRFRPSLCASWLNVAAPPRS
jgi:hypothetical protein